MKKFYQNEKFTFENNKKEKFEKKTKSTPKKKKKILPYLVIDSFFPFAALKASKIVQSSVIKVSWR